MSHQLSHQEYITSIKSQNITILCDHLESPANQGALFRICEAFNVKQIIFYGNVIDINTNRLKRTARSTEKMVAYSCIDDLDATLETFKQSHTDIIGLEITATSVAISDLTLDKNRPILLIIGNEKNGISEKLLEKIEKTTHIPMYGTNSSMNVIQATGIALYSITNDLNTFSIES